MFDMNLIDDKKIFSVLISGNIEQNQVSDFIQQLKATISNIDTQNYNLVVEAKDVEIKSINSMISLSQILNIYKRTDFKRIFAIINDDIKSIKHAEILRRYINQEIIEVNSIDEVMDKTGLL